ARQLDQLRHGLAARRRDADQRDAPVGLVRNTLDVTARLHPVEHSSRRRLVGDGDLGELPDADRLAARERRQASPFGHREALGLHDAMELARDQVTRLRQQRGQVVVDEVRGVGPTLFGRAAPLAAYRLEESRGGPPRAGTIHSSLYLSGGTIAS